MPIIMAEERRESAGENQHRRGGGRRKRERQTGDGNQNDWDAKTMVSDESVLDKRFFIEYFTLISDFCSQQELQEMTLSEDGLVKIQQMEKSQLNEVEQIYYNCLKNYSDTQCLHLVHTYHFWPSPSINYRGVRKFFQIVGQTCNQPNGSIGHKWQRGEAKPRGQTK